MFEKDETIKDSKLKITDLENMFNIYKDDRKNYFYNINSTVYINLSETNVSYYTLKTDAFWPLISYKIYNTPRLVWLLMKINNVDTNEVFVKKRAGDIIKYLSQDQLKIILQRLKI